MMESLTLLSKFKGSVFAALAGDCIGAIYEPNWSPVPFKILMELDEKLKSTGEKLKISAVNRQCCQTLFYIIVIGLIAITQLLQRGINAMCANLG